MKKGWVIKPLGDVFETVTGNTPSKSNAEYYGRYIPLVKPPELQDCELSDAEDGLSEVGARVARVAPPSSILVSCIGNLGKIGFNTVPVAFNQQINAIIPDRSHAIPEFFFYQVLSCRFRDQLESLASGTTVSIVNKSRFNSIEIVLPPLPEQQRIVGLPDGAFGGLATAQAHAAQNLQNARDLFESHLNAIFTQRGKGWVEHRLGDVFDIGSSKRIRESEWASSGVPFYGGKEIVRLSKVGFVVSDAYISEAKYGEYALRYEMPQPGDLLITARGTIGVGYVVRYGDKFYYKDGNIISLREKTPTNPHFVLYAFRSKPVVAQFADLTGATVTHLPIERAKNLLVSMPNFPTQCTVAEHLSNIETEAQRLESVYQRKLVVLEKLKKSLLHQAFSGEL